MFGDLKESVIVMAYKIFRIPSLIKEVRYVVGRWPVLLHDGLMILVSWYLAYFLRFNLGLIPDRFLTQASILLPLVVVCHLVTSIILGVPRGGWRFTSLYDLTKIIQAVVFGTAIVVAIVFAYDRMWAVPRSVFLLQILLLIGFLAGPRVLYRIWHDRGTQHVSNIGIEKVLIVGAGTAGSMLILDLKTAKPQRYHPVALIDDDSGKHGKKRGSPAHSSCNA